MSRYKKVNTERLEQDVYQRNRELGNDPDQFFVVAPENNVCFNRYRVALKERFDDGEHYLMLKNGFHQAGAFCSDFHNNYKLYEITRSKNEDGSTHLKYELMY